MMPGGHTPARVGTALSVLVIVFLLFDAVAKLAQLPQVIEATIGLGYPVATVRPLGVLLLLGVILYAVPRTAVWGAVYLTGYLGGALASHLRIDSPLFSHVLFPVYVGAVLWAGLALRRPALVGLLSASAPPPRRP